MSKTVIIPTTADPWICYINGVRYSYAAGTEQTVPDEVASIIEQAKGYPPEAKAVEQPWNPDIPEPEPELPAVTAADNGKLLGVVAGAWGKVDAPNGLPEVSATDNNKVLTVVNGEWDKAAAAGLPTPYDIYSGWILMSQGSNWTQKQLSGIQTFYYDNGNLVVEGYAQWELSSRLASGLATLGIYVVSEDGRTRVDLGPIYRLYESDADDDVYVLGAGLTYNPTTHAVTPKFVGHFSDSDPYDPTLNYWEEIE